jgi:cobalt/nickel transport system permease protein
MSTIEQRLFDLGQMDRLARQDTPAHRLDPRAKLVVTLAFIAVVVSFEKHTVVALIPLVAYPLVLAGVGRVPWGLLLRKAAYILPFIGLIAAFEPLYEPQTAWTLGPVEVSAGWLSAVSLLLRGLLTVLGALSLVAVTGMGDVCLGLERLKVPKLIVVQLLFLYRYLFVLAHEAARSARARAMRSAGARGQGLRSYGALVGHLGLRTFDRAERIHLAMLCRGFDGEVRTLRDLRLRGMDAAFVLGCGAFFAVTRSLDLPAWIGTLATRPWP